MLLIFNCLMCRSLRLREFLCVCSTKILKDEDRDGKEQDLEWKKAQSIDIQVDLVSAAKTQLKFLAAVDRKRWLYEGPGLEKAIYRYNACWLPLLAKHCESLLLEDQLVVPLDCEWIWHCHRLNPIRYKKDCEELFGRILDNKNVVSSVDGISTISSETIWCKHFPLEPYELDIANGLPDSERVIANRCTEYDLNSAVQRQAPFCYQVSKPHMIDDCYLKGAVARYKAFLHLIRRNKEKGLNSFSVPTYDIDLIWHTHQLHPVSYCNDLMKTMGKVLEHDDTDADRSKGQKLDVGFTETTKLYEEMYGARYWRAGAMYRGTAPSPVRTSPLLGSSSKKIVNSNANQWIAIPAVDAIEVMLEFISVRNIPEGHNAKNLYVSFSKTQPDIIFNTKRSLTIFSETGAKQAASFQCQSTGEFIFELGNLQPSSLHKAPETIGKISVPLEDILQSDLVMEKWLELEPISNTNGSKQIGLRVAVSVTVPTPALYELCMIHSRPVPKGSCLFPLKMSLQFGQKWSRVVDNAGNMVLSLQLRNEKQSKSKGGHSKRVVIGFSESGDTCSLLEFSDSGWSMMNSPWSLNIPNRSANDYDGHFLELTGPQTVRLYTGGRLDYEPRGCRMHKSEFQLEGHLVTAVEFSSKNPYGRAIALLDLKSGDIKVKDEYFILPSILIMFMMNKHKMRNGYKGLALGSNNQKENELPILDSLPLSTEKKVEVAENEEFTTEKTGAPLSGEFEIALNLKSGCGGGCGGGCGECGAGCGNAVKKGAGGGCGGCGAGGCGTMNNGNRVINDGHGSVAA